MSKRNIGQKIIQGLKEVKAWKRGPYREETDALWT